jgi:hypothetical protein
MDKVWTLAFGPEILDSHSRPSPAITLDVHFANFPGPDPRLVRISQPNLAKPHCTVRHNLMKSPLVTGLAGSSDE